MSAATRALPRHGFDDEGRGTESPRERALREELLRVRREVRAAHVHTACGCTPTGPCPVLRALTPELTP